MRRVGSVYDRNEQRIRRHVFKSLRLFAFFVYSSRPGLKVCLDERTPFVVSLNDGVSLAEHVRYWFDDARRIPAVDGLESRVAVLV